MGGGADTLLESKSRSTPGVIPWHGEKTRFINGLEERGGVMGQAGIEARRAGDENSRQASAGGHDGRRGAA
jgi:hypothetical protein